MEEKISVTFKAGTGYDVPWVVLKAASIQEMQQDLAEVQSLFADVSYLAKSFDEAFKSAPKSARELVQNVLGGQHVNTEPVQPETAAPPAPAPSGNPWDSAPAAPAGNPWDNATPGGWTPPVRDFFLIDVPRDKSELWGGPKGPDGKAVKGGGLRGKLQAGGIKIDWNAEEKRNTIPKNADPAALDYIRSQGIELK